MRAITVAFLYDSYLHIGGVETHLLTLLRYGDSTRYRWVVVAPVSLFFQTQATALGAQVLPWRPTCQLDVVALARLVRLFRRYQVGLIHAHSPRAAFLGRVAAGLLGLPIIVTVHVPAYEYVSGPGLCSRSKRWLYRHVERILNHALTDHLIYVSSRIGRQAVEGGLAPPSRMSIIENGIDVSPFAECKHGRRIREELGASLQTIVLCCIGRLTEQKGVDILLEAFRLLEPSKRNLHLWLIGDGPQRAALEAQARQFGLDTAVQFLGFRNDVPDLLLAADVFVLPSRYEAMPVSVLEAMAAGLPCVVTDVGDNAVLVEDGVSGRVVPPQDPAALAAALEQLLVDAELRRAMGNTGRRRARHYSADWMVARTLAVYERVLNG